MLYDQNCNTQSKRFKRTIEEMALVTILSITLLMAGSLHVKAFYIEEDYRELQRSPEFLSEHQEQQRDSDFDDGFGSDLDNFVTKNPLKCPNKCEYSLDCCRGEICLKRGKGTGYCVKGCKNATPAAPLQDCRLCMTCTKGYVCTLKLSGEYICMPDNKTTNRSKHSKRGY